MKALKKIALLVAALSIALSCVSFNVSAASTASITVQNQDGTNATIANKTLNLFKIFEATKSADGSSTFYNWIKEADGTNRYEDFFIGTESYAKLPAGSTINSVVEYIDALKTDASNFSKMTTAFHEYLHKDEAEFNRLKADAENFRTSGTIGASATFYTFTNLSLGYYVIFDATEFDPADPTPAVRSAAMLSHAGENKVIYLKADRPHLVKQVNDNDDATTPAEWKAGTTASVGDIVDFRIVTKIPNHEHYSGNYTFEISDVMSDALELVIEDGKTLADSVTVTVTNPENADPTKIVAADYDIKSGNELSAEEQAAGVDFKVVVNNTLDVLTDTLIEVTYKAKVLGTAAKLNENTATLTYSNDPNKATSIGQTSSTVNVGLWQLTLSKHLEDVYGDATKERLAGAEFKIYKKVGDNEVALKFAASEITSPVNGVTYTKYTLAEDSAVVNGTTIVDTLKTLDGGAGVDDGKSDVGFTDGEFLGQILVFGIDEGTYIIKETKAPDGYQLAEGSFEVTLSDTVGQSGAISDASLTTTARDSSLSGKFTRVHLVENELKCYVGITNAPGNALPETGGIGTTLFTIAGVILMAGALAFFTSRKRSSAV